jgi:hypothetical protein
VRTPSIVAAGLLAALVSATPAAAQDAGAALAFDGTTDSVRLHPTASILPATWQSTKSVSVWINPTGVPTCTGPDPGSCDAIFGDRPRTWGISRGVIGGQDRIWVWNYDGTFDRVGIEYTPNTWTQVALVHGGGVLSAYKDGTFVGSVASGPTTLVASTVLYFGGIINNASRNWTFQGDIDEVQVWSIALNAAQVAALMNGPLAGSEAGLAAYYRMTNEVGTSVTDDTGHGWTGTLLDGGSGVPGNGPILWVPSGAFGGGGSTPNTPPTANSQSVSTAEDTPVAVTVTGSDVDENPLTFRVIAPPAHGIVTGTAPNFTYTPATNYFGSDSFTFVANDGRADSAAATVSITVLPVNDPPIANPNSVVTAKNTPVSISVLANDSDVEGNILSVSSVTQPQHGTATNQVTSVLYTPANGYSGPDSFTYTVSDGQGGFATATVSVNVINGSVDPGLALRFDGTSDNVLLAKTAHLLGTGWETTKTVSMWVKAEGTPYCNAPSPASCDAIFGDRPRWWGISRGVLGGLDRIWVWNYDGAYKSIAIPYTVGEWLHISMVHGGGVLSAYKNGVLVGSLASGATLQPTTGALPSLQFGGIINNATRNWTFRGEIDEVQLWNTARTASQIASDMAGPLTGAELGLAAYYRMTNGSGTTLTDDSGHGWTGTLVDGGIEVPADGAILWVPSGAFSVPPPQ